MDIYNKQKKSTKLDEVLQEVPETLQKNRKIREDWFEWHSQWKEAWLTECPSYTDPSLLNLKEQTTIKNRKLL